ncbi:MAG: glycosyltransferase [Clostridiales bacterium]|nr:glycosyltransferase [Clostridiales bacterium]
MSDNDQELVSICIATYNGGKFIREALESIKAQSYGNIEVVVTDDCSSDDTLDICSEYDFVTVYHNETRQGLVGNWNRAISKASGKYIKLMGQDDVLAPDSVRIQVEALKNNPGASISIGASDVISEKSERLMTRKLSNKDFVMDGVKFAKRSLWNRNIYCEPANAMYTAEAASKAGLYDKEYIYVPDWEYAIKLSLQGKVCYSASTVFSFRISSGSETSTLYRKKNYEMLKDTDKLFMNYKERLGLTGFQEVYFKLMSRLRMHARLLFIRLKK